MAFTSDHLPTVQARAASESASAAPDRAPTQQSSAWAGSPRQLKQRAQLAQLTQQPAPAAPAPAASAEGGLPQGLRMGVEALSGLDMSGVRVHRNSSKPATLQAHAYAQGEDIHLGPGQDRHLAHEAWHVVQQKQQRVRPTLQLKGGTQINDDGALEREADVMGAKAMAHAAPSAAQRRAAPAGSGAGAVQRKIKIDNPDMLLSAEEDFKLLKLDGKRYGKFIPRIKEMIKDPDTTHPFGTIGHLLSFLESPPPAKKSHYAGISPILIKKTKELPELGLIPLYRAMSTGEANALRSKGDFAMRLNSDNLESGIKFFATDINYSIGLSNKKNDEAYLKHTKEEDLPYTTMFQTAVWSPHVYQGLVNDIGVHKDQDHTKNKLGSEWSESAYKSLEETSGQEWMSTVVTAQGPQDDEDSHGYVLKHESGGFNFGVKAASKENMVGATQTPMEYFNDLIGEINQIGVFQMG